MSTQSWCNSCSGSNNSTYQIIALPVAADWISLVGLLPDYQRLLEFEQNLAEWRV